MKDNKYYDFINLQSKLWADEDTCPLRKDILLDIIATLMLNDNTYNYELYVKDNNPFINLLTTYGGGHFPDTYKTVYHPSFSNLSLYSNKVSEYNPLGIEGGIWKGDDTYILSPDLILHNWNVDRTLRYLNEAEKVPVSVLNPNGNIINVSLPIQYSTEGNLYKGGSWLDSIKEYFSPTIKSTGRSHVNITRDKEGVKVNGKTPEEGYRFYDRSTGKQYVYRGGKFIIDTGRRHNNNSPTNNKSQVVEDKMETILYNRLKSKPNEKYFIPYNDTDEINGVSRNILDSVAKYAGLAGTSIVEGLGLALHETKFGRTPWFNTKEGDSDWNRTLLNTNYAENKGGIPAEYLVRDYNYNGGVYGDAPIQDRNTPPLLHAFLYFNSGRYNTRLPNHTYDVRRDGLEFFSNPEVLNWWNREGLYWYNGTYRNINDELNVKQPLIDANNRVLEESLGVPEGSISLPNYFAHPLYNVTRDYGIYTPLDRRPSTLK